MRGRFVCHGCVLSKTPTTARGGEAGVAVKHAGEVAYTPIEQFLSELRERKDRQVPAN